MRTYYIYGLGDPRDGEVRYVGCTVDLLKRHRAHHSTGSGNIVNSWTAELRSRKMSPVLVLLDTTEAPDTPRDLEAAWIDNFIQRGHPLLNQQNRKGRSINKSLLLTGF
jgi:hypothetical protein